SRRAGACPKRYRTNVTASPTTPTWVSNRDPSRPKKPRASRWRGSPRSTSAMSGPLSTKTGPSGNAIHHLVHVAASGRCSLRVDDARDLEEPRPLGLLRVTLAKSPFEQPPGDSRP